MYTVIGNLLPLLRRPLSVTRACSPVMAFLTRYVLDNALGSAGGTIFLRRSQRWAEAVLVPWQRTDGVDETMIGVILLLYPICPLLYIY